MDIVSIFENFKSCVLSVLLFLKVVEDVSYLVVLQLGIIMKLMLVLEII